MCFLTRVFNSLILPGQKEYQNVPCLRVRIGHAVKWILSKISIFDKKLRRGNPL